MPLSIQQGHIVEFGKNQRGSLLIKALAGTGKTYTLLELLKVLRGTTALTAYNNKIAAELDEKVTKAGIRTATVGTCHKYGFAAIRKAIPGIMLEGKGKGRAGFYKFDKIAEALDIPTKYQNFCYKAVSLAKQRAIGFLTPFNDADEWMNLVRHYDLAELLFDPEKTGKEKFEDRFLAAVDAEGQEKIIKEALQYACKALKMNLTVTAEDKVIDFDDMIYMPLVMKMSFQQYDNVLVDEAQDTNPARRALVKAMMKPGGRAIFVGDDNQAIYGFTGADNDALEIIRKEFNCTVMPLTMTYRCAKAVVAQAKQFVPSYEAFDTNAEGSYSTISAANFDDTIPTLKPGEDAILCRNTKPLVEMAFRLIRNQIPCRVEGKDIGKDLVRIIKKFERRCVTLNDMQECLENYRDEEITSLMAQGKEMAAESLEDRIDTIIVVIQSLDRNAGIIDLITKIDDLFDDTKEGEKVEKVILMTMHRSKGLEWKRVFLLGRNKYCPSRYARQDWQMAQEANLEYVGITRAIETLVDILVY